MITVNHLYKRFGERAVLRDINLTVEEGEVVALIGPSGSGKSTLLRCLNLLEQPDAGVIRIGDVTLDAARCRRREAHALRQQTAMVFQNYSLFRNKTALENVTEGLIMVKRLPRAEANAQAMALLASVGLAAQAQQYPVTLSGGQQQRVSIARALALNPRAILFDEPTSALDPERVHEVLQVIRRLAQQKTTLLIVTHEMGFAREVADRVIVMADGQIIEQGPAEQIIRFSTHPLTRRFLRQLHSPASAGDYVI